jgi:hypothetical protein
MTTPTYRLFAYHGHLIGGRLFRRTWRVTDGRTDVVLASGTAFTRRGAERARATAAAGCEPCLALRLELVADRLGREGLHVAVRLDAQDRVCVRPLCACSTRDEVRVLRAFLALTSAVRWEVSR